MKNLGLLAVMYSLEMLLEKGNDKDALTLIKKIISQIEKR
ncbi:hypothetical protein AGMMS49975_18400 [Clostridia bacterium]|nr:hypothetical protein AGMMS49975_18400 [Clostridia bacterium]